MDPSSGSFRNGAGANGLPCCSPPFGELRSNHFDRFLVADGAQPRHRGYLRVTQRLRFRLPPLLPAQEPARTQPFALGLEDALIPVHLSDDVPGQLGELYNPPALAQARSVLFPGVLDGGWELGCDLLADVRRDAYVTGRGQSL